MAWWPKLLSHQVELLRRIAAGGDPVTSRESALAVSVYALRTRRLVRTPRSDGVWTAVLTDAGRFYFEHGCYQRDAGAAVGQQAPAVARTPRRQACGG